MIEVGWKGEKHWKSRCCVSPHREIFKGYQLYDAGPWEREGFTESGKRVYCEARAIMENLERADEVRPTNRCFYINRLFVTLH